MKVTIFVDWHEQEVYTEAERDKIVEQNADEAYYDEYQFSGWLCENYNASEIWDMTEEDRERVQATWREACIQDAIDELCYDEIEVEV